MNRFRVVLAAVAVGMVFIACEPFLVHQDQFPDFKAPADKALCVVIRPAGMFGDLAKIYCDGKIEGGTFGNNVMSFEVSPGPHLVLSKIRTISKVKFNFQAGKVYYILQAAFPVPFVGTSTSLVPMPGAEATAKLEQEKGKCKYSQYNVKSQEPDLDKKDVDDEMKDYDEWAQKNPDKAKVEAEYPGN
jgi:hypothetical protein